MNVKIPEYQIFVGVCVREHTTKHNHEDNWYEGYDREVFRARVCRKGLGSLGDHIMMPQLIVETFVHA